MVKTFVTGFPRIGEKRELKRATESFFKGDLSEKELYNAGRELRVKHWKLQKEYGVEFISSNDFSFYDNMLDMAFLLNIIPKRYKELPISTLERYFAAAKGFQKGEYDVKALEMKKWFNTNYHYVVPEIEEDAQISLNGTKLFDEYDEALNIGIVTKPVLIGPYTFLKLSKINDETKTWSDYIPQIAEVYMEIIKKLAEKGVEYIQIDEPAFVMDVSEVDKERINEIYNVILKKKKKSKILLNTYFGDIRDVYQLLQNMDIEAIGLDFVEGSKNLELIEEYGNKKIIFAGIVNGKNIWINDYMKSINIIKKLEKYKVVIGTSCSLLHVPYTLRYETKIDKKYLEYMSFAEEKLNEIREISKIVLSGEKYISTSIFTNNQEIVSRKKADETLIKRSVRELIKNAELKDFHRAQSYNTRFESQEKVFGLPKLPTTTIGSFPQTDDVRKVRADLRVGKINESKYKEYIKNKIKRIVGIQEEIGLDVLVHGEYERNDMVEYFGENLNGFLFTENGWVQSYGTRGVKPPVIIGDVYRKSPITVEWISYAQSQTSKIMKGMLTGPVTISNWSFNRDDISQKEIVYQIAFAIKEEVEDLERDGIKIIQIDEAALREKLPLRKEDWNEKYLDWAIKAFRITCADLSEMTQIHSHFCYSDFADIFASIDGMDADVITIEAAKSDLKMVDFIGEFGYKRESGPGVYDIHSPRIPCENEFKGIIEKMISKIGKEKLWINPDCGLKTRKEEETFESLRNMVKATMVLR